MSEPVPGKWNEEQASFSVDSKAEMEVLEEKTQTGEHPLLALVRKSKGCPCDSMAGSESEMVLGVDLGREWREPGKVQVLTAVTV